MAAIWISAAAASAVSAQAPPQQAPPYEEHKPPEQRRPTEEAPPPQAMPPEEDESERPTVYSYNPLQAEQALKAGKFYWSKPNYRAAASRFEEATKWDPKSAEAFFLLAEASEKLNRKDQARSAYEKVVQLAPDSKDGKKAKKKIGKK